jgi:hypothetical protein
MATPPGSDDEVRALYHGPLGEFTAARQVLARRLRKAGDPRAGEVAALGKPTASAWAVNALFARDARALRAFVAAGERARAGVERAAAGDAAPLRAALATIRDETPRLLARAVELLAAAERAPGEAIVERIRTNLEALALDPATAAVAARGWLDEDLAPPGFEIMAALQLAAAGVKTAMPAAAPTAPRKAGAPSQPPRRAAAPKPSAPAPPPSRPLATVTRFADAAERRAAAERAAQENRERREREQRERERETRRERLRVEAAEAERVAAEQRAAAEAAAAAAERAVKEAEAAQRSAAEAQARARETRQTAIAAEAVARRARAALERAGKE